jgi:N-acetylneuraminate synthase
MVHPAYIVAEIGINHNGDLDVAKDMILSARNRCGCRQTAKTHPELCVPPEQRGIMRETPWGYIPYLEYREHVEFGRKEY